MKLKLLKCDWGMEGLGDVASRLRKYAEAGYDGVEAAFINMESAQLSETLIEHKLDYVPMLFARDEQEFRDQLEKIKSLNPLIVNCHPGRDHFDFNRGLVFFKEVMAVADGELDCEILFETHRQTLLYAPWTTKRYLDAIPDLKLTADFSHFTCVSESNLSDLMHANLDWSEAEGSLFKVKKDLQLSELMDAAIQRACHIHARVGWSHGPQVADPKHREGYKWTLLFEEWWDRIIEKCLEENREFLAVNPEFGPPPYAPTNPMTDEPFIDIWDVCLWISQRFRDRWSERLDCSPGLYLGVAP